MSEHLQSKAEKTSTGQQTVLCFMSILLGGAAIWYAWLRFITLVNRTNASWYEWIQPSMVVLFGLLSLVAAVLFMRRKPDASSYFKLGLSIVPLILFVNLLILVFRATASVLQGNAGFLLERVLSQPLKFILIPVIIIAFIVLDRLNNTENPKS